MFDNAYAEENARANFGRPEYQTVALDAAHEAVTLVKNNNNILPLAKNKKVLVMGSTAQSIAALNGSWSYTCRAIKMNGILKTVKQLLMPSLIKLAQLM
ncbi:MAG: hypothetical protein WDM90_22015 [Ferruginibacter sp.]